MPEWFSFRLWKNARNIYVRGGFLKVIPSGDRSMDLRGPRRVALTPRLH